MNPMRIVLATFWRPLSSRSRRCFYGEACWPTLCVFASAMVIATVGAASVILVPAVSLYRGNQRGVLSRAQGRHRRDGGRLEDGLVIAEVALAVMSRQVRRCHVAAVVVSFLYGVSAIDSIAFALAGPPLLSVGMLAAFVLAWRAGMTDPAIALREQIGRSFDSGSRRALALTEFKMSRSGYTQTRYPLDRHAGHPVSRMRVIRGDYARINAWLLQEVDPQSETLR